MSKMDDSLWRLSLEDYAKRLAQRGQSSDYEMDDRSLDQSFSSQSQYLERGQTPPAVITTLEDYVVQKRPGKGKGKAAHAKFTSDSKKQIPLEENEIMNRLAVEPHGSPSLTRGSRVHVRAPDFVSSRVRPSEGVSTIQLTNPLVLFDFPKHIHEEGYIRYSEHSNKDVSAFRWFPGALSWKQIGRMSAAKFEHFKKRVEALLHSQRSSSTEPSIDTKRFSLQCSQLFAFVCNSQLHAPANEKQNYSENMTPLTQQINLIHGVKAMDPERDATQTYAQTAQAALFQRSQLSAQLQNFDQQSHYYPTHFSNEKNYSDYMTNDYFPSSGSHLNSKYDQARRYIDPYQRMDNQSLLDPRESSFRNSRHQNFPNNRRIGFPNQPIWQQSQTQTQFPYNRPILSAVKGTDGDHELRRTVANDPLRKPVMILAPGPPTSSTDLKTVPKAPLSSTLKKSSIEDDDASLASATTSANKSYFPNERRKSIEKFFDPTIDTKHMPDDQLRDFQTIDPARVKGPYFTGQNTKLLYGIDYSGQKSTQTYDERLEAWWNSGRKDLDRQQERAKHILSSQGKSNDPDAQVSVSLLIAVHERLEEYAKHSNSIASRPVPYFSRFSKPPESCIDPMANFSGLKGSMSGVDKSISLFSDDGTEIAAQQSGEDPRSGSATSFNFSGTMATPLGFIPRL